MKLFGFELAWATAAFDAIFPERTALPHGIARMQPGRFLADVVASSPFEQSIGLRLTLWMIALAPLWLLRRPKTIADIRPEERQRVLELLISSPVYAVRQLVVAFKALGSMLYSQSPAARASMTAPRERTERLVTLRLASSNTPETLVPLRHGDAHEHAAE